VCFWLVVVFELPVGGHIRKRRFFSIFLSRSVRRPERRDTPPHTRRRRRRQRGTIASDGGGGGGGGGGGALQQAQASRPIGSRPARHRVQTHAPSVSASSGGIEA